MEEKCPYYQKAEPYTHEEGNLGPDKSSYEPEEAEHFICNLPNLDSDKAKLKVQCQGDVNKCDNMGDYSEILIDR